ncbi:hypothetical protein [Staphylococcus epidermidis]|uniref:hypothetical protein n=1 Tax=Staphylococcus epidermidis TaxID=1282 RepID=UPI00024E4855|nr:hypothetical protein [Staphylococcus epidermidis]EHS00321.1 putative lipoprotein [Staphylococcus epidermidis VCU128]
MKKVLFLIFASLLVLGACGQNEDKSNKDDNKKSESKSDKKSNAPKKNKKSDSKKENSKNAEQYDSNSNNNTTTNEKQSISKNDNGKSQDNNGNNERIQGENATQQQNRGNQQTNNQQIQGTPFNKDMPVAHDGGQNGYGYGDYLAAKEASEKARRGELQGVGGSWGVAPGQDFNSWRDQQAKIQNERAVPNE